VCAWLLDTARATASGALMVSMVAESAASTVGVADSAAETEEASTAVVADSTAATAA